MIGVHMLDDVGFRASQSLRAGKIDQQIAGLEVDDAAETADKVRALNNELVKREVREICVHPARGVALEKAAPVGGAFGDNDPAKERHASPRQRVTRRRGAVEQQTGLRVSDQILRMQRELGDQH